MRTRTLTGTCSQTQTLTGEPNWQTGSLCIPVRASNKQTTNMLSPVDVVVLMHAVQLQFKATQQVLDHDPQVVVEDPGAKTG